MSTEAEFFDEHGWIVLRDVVSSDRLAALGDAFDRVVGPFVAGPATGQGKGIWQIPGARNMAPGLMAHLDHELSGRVAALLGAASVRLLQDTLIFKPAGAAGEVELHQDYTYTGFLNPPASASIRLSLSPADRLGGCLYVIDGSHRWGPLGQLAIGSSAMQGDGEVLARLPVECRDQVDERRVALELAPGDVTIHHCLTLHGSYPNLSDVTRKTIVTHVFDSACTVLPDRLPQGAAAHLPTDHEGRLTGDGFPALYP